MFDRAEYKSNILFLLEKAYAEYRTVSYDIPGRQVETLKTYLWLGSVLGAFELVFFSQVISGDTGLAFIAVSPPYMFFAFAFVAAGCSLFSFAWAIDALRERTTQGLPFGDFMALAGMAEEDARDKDQYSLHISILNALNDEILIQAASCDRRGRIVQRLSGFQLASLAMTVCAVIAAWE